MKKLLILISLSSLLLLVTPVLMKAETTEYRLLAPLPLEGADAPTTERTTAGNYIKGIFTLLIAIAGGLAVIMIIFGGIKYMSTDAFSGKSEAKTTIQNAIWGLLLAISAWLILNTINPNLLVNFNLSLPSAQSTQNPLASAPSVNLTFCYSEHTNRLHNKSNSCG